MRFPVRKCRYLSERGLTAGVTVTLIRYRYAKLIIFIYETYVCEYSLLNVIRTFAKAQNNCKYFHDIFCCVMQFSVDSLPNRVSVL